MVRCYIALGSNIGDRRKYLRDAVMVLLQHPQVGFVAQSPVYQTPALLPENAPKEWNIAFLNQVVALDTALEPLALLALLKHTEETLGRRMRGHWGPREIDCDLLLYADEVIDCPSLQVPHPRMCERRFVMQPLNDIAPDVTVNGKAVAAWLGLLPDDPGMQLYVAKPALMGILNVTPDSFSDGGRYFDPESALKQLRTLVEHGADVIDIGAESTRPGALALSYAKEWARLEPLLSRICQEFGDRTWRLSIDTYHPETAQKAIAFGVDWINDVTGFIDEAMIDVVRAEKVSLVVMHSLGVPADPSVTMPADIPVTAALIHWANSTVERLESEGIGRERIILDPGIGFGKTAEQSIQLMDDAPIIVRSVQGVTWLYGHSRKSFMKTRGAESMADRDAMTLGYSALLAKAGVDYVRVHDVAAHKALFRYN